MIKMENQRQKKGNLESTKWKQLNLIIYLWSFIII